MKLRVAATLLLLLGSPAFAGVLVYDAFLSGANELPANASPGTGFATVTFDTVSQMMEVKVSFTGLEGPAVASHIHAPSPGVGTGNAGVATAIPSFPGFPSATSGTYDHTFDMTLSSSYNPSYITSNGGVAGAEAALLTALATDHAYLNIHTPSFPGGEIEGFLLPTPEPGTMLLAAAALAGFAIRRRR